MFFSDMNMNMFSFRYGPYVACITFCVLSISSCPFIGCNCLILHESRGAVRPDEECCCVGAQQVF